MKSFNLKDTLLELPSGGESLGVKLLANNCVKIRPMSAGDQKTIASQGQDAYKIYYTLLDKVIVEPEKLSYDKMLMSDANVILYSVRIMTLGPEYGIMYKCESCESPERCDLDLNSVEVRYASDIDDYAFEAITIELPQSGHNLTVHLPKVGDEKKVSNAIVNMRKRGGSVSDLDRSYVRLASLIDEIDGEKVSTIMKVVEFVNDLPLPDFIKLSEQIADRDTGLVPELSATCGACGWDNLVRLEINSEFFRPRPKSK